MTRVLKIRYSGMSKRVGLVRVTLNGANCCLLYVQGCCGGLVTSVSVFLADFMIMATRFFLRLRELMSLYFRISERGFDD